MDNPDKNQTQNLRAIIDVGSNSVKLLVAEVVDGVVRPLFHEGQQTRLGRGVFETGELEAEAIAGVLKTQDDIRKKVSQATRDLAPADEEDEEEQPGKGDKDKKKKKKKTR